MSRRVVRIAVFLLVLATPVLGVTRRWINTGEGAGGQWTDGSLWSPAGVPQAGDDLLLNTPGNYSCSTNGSFQPQTLVVGGGSGKRAVEVSAGTTLTTLFSTKFNFNSDITVNGTLAGAGSITVNQGGVVRMNPGSALTGTGEFFANLDSTLLIGDCQIVQRPVRMEGSAVLSGVTTMSQGASITNVGVAVLSGGLGRGDTSAMTFDNQGTLTVQGTNLPVGVDVTNSGDVVIKSGTLDVSSSSYKQSGGKTTIAPGASLAGPVDISSGILNTSGSVNGNVTNGGEIALATPVSFATAQINGNYTQLPSGVLNLKIGGISQFDRLLISGIANLAGKISITFVQGYIPAIGAEFPIMTFGSRSGDFAFYEGVDLGDIEMVPVHTPNGLSLVAQVKQVCPEGKLCLNQGRFEVSLGATDPRTGNVGNGEPVRQNDIFGYFSIPDLTNDPSNPEVFIKILDGRAFNGKFWVFYGSLTDFELTLTVLDVETQTSRTYTRPGGEACGEYDTDAFAKAGSFAIVSPSELSTELHAMRLGRFPGGRESLEPSPDVGCAPTETSLCLLQSRFAVTLKARDQRTDRTATGRTIPRNDLFGYFTLPDLTGDPDNVEVFVKILDGRTINGKFWVFFGGLTDLEYTLTVRDVEASTEKVYMKEAGSACGQFDVAAF
jgi:hypothetical protein